MRRLRDERGAALVEFAFVAPFLFAVVFGSIALLWLTGMRSYVTGAAQDGARFASIAHDPLAPCVTATPPCPATGYPTVSEVETYVKTRSNVDSVNVTAATYRNQIVTVTVTRRIPALFGWFDFTYTSTAKARTE